MRKTPVMDIFLLAEQLQARGLSAQAFDRNYVHIRIGNIDLWPTTGSWKYMPTREFRKGNIHDFLKYLDVVIKKEATLITTITRKDK